MSPFKFTIGRGKVITEWRVIGYAALLKGEILLNNIEDVLTTPGAIPVLNILVYYYDLWFKENHYGESSQSYPQGIQCLVKPNFAARIFYAELPGQEVNTWSKMQRINITDIVSEKRLKREFKKMISTLFGDRT